PSHAPPPPTIILPPRNFFRETPLTQKNIDANLERVRTIIKKISKPKSLFQTPIQTAPPNLSVPTNA
ncbi:hypothetical protein BMT55_13045, partial [Listeria newyorkensis]